MAMRPRRSVNIASRRTETLRATTFRDFDGGLNLVDNDQNMAPKFFKRLSNMYRSQGGTLAIRYGTRSFCDISQVTTYPITDLDDWQIDFTGTGTPNLTIVRPLHGLATGNNITLSGFAAAVNGVAAAAFNATFAVTVVDDSRFTINVGAYVATDPLLTAVSLAGLGNYSNPNSTLTGNIVNLVYYNSRLVVVTSTGQIGLVTGAGALTACWNATIAGVKGVAAWSTTSFASFAEFNGELIICNGVDKPLLLKADLSINYLVDIGTGSNAFVPTAKYVMAMNHFCLMAGDPANPNTLYISHKDASGTWFGAPAPNIGVNLNLAKYSGASTIKGLSRFRDNVVVGFETRHLLGQLNIYDGSGNHTPSFEDQIELFGTISHRCMHNLGNELLTCDNNGVPSLTQVTFSTTLRPKSASRLVDPSLRVRLRALSTAALEDRTFAVYNRNEDQYMLFVPNDQTAAKTTETTCYVFNNGMSAAEDNWAIFNGWNFVAGCVSRQNRLFLCDSKIIYLYGSLDNTISADFINAAGGATGTEITFTAEWPWTDFGDRVHIKTSRYLQLETSGTALFTLQMFVDKILVDANNADNPELSMQFIGGDSGGYGNGPQPYGGGRRTVDERLWAWPSKFKIAKFRISGSTTDPLAVISMTILRQHGSIRR